MTQHALAAFSAQLARPAYAYRQLAKMPLQHNAATGHVRAVIPADIPDNAIVLKADVVFEIDTAYAGSKTFNLRRHNARLLATVTWDSRPPVVGSTWSTTLADAAVGAKVAISVIDDVQAFVAGSLDNFGWQLSTTSATAVYFKGVPAALGDPYLDLDWVLPGEPPTDLAPIGRIATGNPTLTFQLPEGTTHIQVQVSTTEAFAATVYDSGQIVAAGNSFQLTGYTIPDDATRYWRIKTWAGGVPSDWSPAAEVIRDDLAAGAITAPGANTGDPEPTLTWTFPGQAAWQAWLYDVTRGRYAADSGRRADGDQAWTPEAGLLGEGTGKFILDLFDDKADRVPTPGVPVSRRLEHTFTVNAVGVDEGVADLVATQRGGTPIVDLTWSIPVALPAGSKIQILRNGRFLKRVDRTVTEFADRTAPRFTNLTYKVAVVNAAGDVSTLGPTDLIYPASYGVWLLDPDVGFAATAAAVLLDKDEGSPTMGEQAIVHQVVGRAPVRRRIGILPPTSTQTGRVLAVAGLTADEIFDTLMAWKVKDAGKVYRLVLGHWNIPVTVGDIQAFPTANSDGSGEREYKASYTWWQTDAELPWR